MSPSSAAGRTWGAAKARFHGTGAVRGRGAGLYQKLRLGRGSEEDGDVSQPRRVARHPARQALAPGAVDVPASDRDEALPAITAGGPGGASSSPPTARHRTHGTADAHLGAGRIRQDDSAGGLDGV